MAEKQIRFVRAQSLHGTLVSQLRTMIQQGELAPGQQIVESGLSETFGVSRTPVREALKVLSSEGLVELRPRRTPMVAPVDADEIASIFEVMEGLEAVAGRRAAENLTPADLDGLFAMHAEMTRLHDAGDRAGYAESNRGIHTRIVELAGNPVLTATYAGFSVKIQRARSTTNYDAGRWIESIREHEQIMEAFRSGTPQQVADVLVDHTRRTGAAVIRTLKRAREVSV